MKKNKTLRYLFWGALSLFLGALITLFCINAHVKNTTEARILSPEAAAEAGDYDCILVLGCLVREDNSPSDMLRDRLDRAMELFDAGAAPKLLMSGDHGREDYDEVNVMKAYAVERGAVSADVFMDHAGFCTYDSVYRAREVFCCEKVLIVTQQYHLYRALYIAEKLGLEAYGVASDYHTYSGQAMREAREICGRAKDFFTSLLKPLPAYLGEIIPISGDGNLTNDGENFVSVPTEEELAAARRAELLFSLQNANRKIPFTAKMLEKLEELDENAVEKLSSLLERGYSQDAFFQEFDLSELALSLLSQDTLPDNVHVLSAKNDGETTLAFTGDINLADNWHLMRHYEEHGGFSVKKAFGTSLLEQMQGADLLTINNEFCYSERGTRMDGKTYTFRASPDNVSVLKEIGTDLAGLANNHCYDFGADAFADTMQTLRDAEIPYVGAGKNLDEAMTPQYFLIDGRVIAIASATRAEKHILTPEATETTSGVLRTYDSARFLSVIRAARENADFVIAYVHWGAEDQTYLEDAVVTQGKEYIDAGADAVVGAHAHCLQAVGYYKGKPIFYNLGNFLFNLQEIDTALATITLTEDGVQARMIPCLQKDASVREVSGTEDGERILETLRTLSEGITVAADGTFTPAAGN